MSRILLTLVAGGLVVAAGCNNGVAQNESAAAAMDPAVPVEVYTCNYNEGKGPADLDPAIAKWNAWADSQGFNDYTAWTLTKFYSSEEQEFDVLWLGIASNGKSLGRAQDIWIAQGGAIQAEIFSVVNCNAHSNFAALNFKRPPERETPPSNVVISFSDCTIADGKNFGDVAPKMQAWAKYRTDNGSAGGIWVFFPAYGGGGETFDFKYVTGYINHETQGADWDQYSEGGWQKAEELFGGLLDCDSSRVYNAQNRRQATEQG